MCLFAVDGTWSTNVNDSDYGVDPLGRPIGGEEGEGLRSNTRRFYQECGYPPDQKFYFSGPGKGFSGLDSTQIYIGILNIIQEQISSGNCEEIVMVGWSRGAAIISEITQGLATLEGVPPIKFIGLFDSVAMIWSSSPHGRRWGESISEQTQFLAHAIAGDRTGPVPIPNAPGFRPANPEVAAVQIKTRIFDGVDHGGIGGRDDTAEAQAAYAFIRRHATSAGVP